MENLHKAQDYFDSLIGLALAKQAAFGDTVPDHWSTLKFSVEGEKYLVTIPSMGKFEAQCLGTESFITKRWVHAWADESLSPSATRGALAFKNDLEKLWKHPAFIMAKPPLSIVNGDYIGVMSTQFLGASTYLAMPSDNGLRFFALFDLPPLLNFSPTPLGRIDLVFEMIDQSTQVKNRELAHRQYLTAEGFKPNRTAIPNGYKDIFVDQQGREITYEVKKEIDRYNEEMTTISRSINLNKTNLRQDSRFDYLKQWEWCLRAPLDRNAINFNMPFDEHIEFC